MDAEKSTAKSPVQKCAAYTEYFFRIFYIYLIFRSRRGCWNSGGHVDVQYKRKNFLEELT